MDTTTTPTASDEAALEADLRAQADAFDNGREVVKPAAPDPQPKSEAGKQTPSDKDTAAQTEKKAQETPKPQDTPAKTDAQQTDATKYQQKRTEKERLDDSWKKFQEEKEKTRAEIEAERKAIAAERDAIRRERESSTQTQRAEQAQGPLAKYSVTELRDAMRDYEAAGDYAKADTLKHELERRQRAASEAPAAQAERAPSNAGPSPQEQERILAEWKQNLVKCEEEVPEFKDPNGEFRKEVATFFQQAPELTRFGNGIRYMVEHVKLAREARKVPTLTAELEGLKKQNAELLGKLNPGGGNPERIGTTRRMEDMNEAEAEAEIRRQAAEFDRAA